MLQKSGRLVLWEAMFILELHSAETQVSYGYLLILSHAAFERLHLSAAPQQSYPGSYADYTLFKHMQRYSDGVK